jgi:hypothetical protein
MRDAAASWHPWRELATTDDVHLVPLDVDGAWDPDQPESIWLDRSLNQAQRRSTLTHELIHRERGDEAGCTPWHTRHQERLVDAEAARRLIPLDALVEVLLWTVDTGEIAEALWVDPRTVHARLRDLSDAEHKLIDERLWAAESRMP